MLQRWLKPATLLGAALAIPACQTTNLFWRQPTPAAAERSVVVLGTARGVEQDQFEATWAPFERQTGIDVVYEGTDDFARLITERVAAGNSPGIAVFPQPGLMAELARSGQVVPLQSFMDPAELRQVYSQSWLDLATVDDEIYGIWHGVAVKSLVWYNPQAFAAKGYTVPQTWAELIALSDRIVADGGTPWCLGLESGAATGWVGTDWIEDILLRTADIEVYDQWVTNEVKFNTPPVQAAFEQFRDIVFETGYVTGGTLGVISTAIDESPLGLFDAPPRCYLHRQASFARNFFPDDVVPGKTADVFMLPPVSAEIGAPVLVGGNLFAMMRDTPEARALLTYLATKTPHEIGIQQGGFISPHLQIKPEAYPDVVMQHQAEILHQAKVIRFDGSDMMPGAVGTDEFWLGVVNYINGQELDDVLTQIDASWPK